jgi:ApbE family
MTEHFLITAFVLLLSSDVSEAQSPDRFEFSHPQMGTVFKIVCYADKEEIAAAAARRAFERVDTLNARYSDYLPESELNRLCARAGTGERVPISRDLWYILKQSEHYSKASAGAFDVSIGALSRLWRRARNLKTVPDSARISEALKTTDYRNILLDKRLRLFGLLRLARAEGYTTRPRRHRTGLCRGCVPAHAASQRYPAGFGRCRRRYRARRRAAGKVGLGHRNPSRRQRKKNFVPKKLRHHHIGRAVSLRGAPGPALFAHHRSAHGLGTDEPPAGYGTGTARHGGRCLGHGVERVGRRRVEENRKETAGVAGLVFPAAGVRLQNMQDNCCIFNIIQTSENCTPAPR